jgi:hypothetical protein
MGWLSKFSPAARQRGERDVLALIFMEYFVPAIEISVRNNPILVQGYSTQNTARECYTSMLNDMMNALGPHFSNLQVYNNSRNSEVVSIGISRDLDRLIWQGDLLDEGKIIIDLKKLTNAFDVMVFDMGMRAVKAASDGAIKMSVESVVAQIESTFGELARQRYQYRNPYGTKDWRNFR